MLMAISWFGITQSNQEYTYDYVNPSWSNIIIQTPTPGYLLLPNVKLVNPQPGRTQMHALRLASNMTIVWSNKYVVANGWDTLKSIVGLDVKYRDLAYYVCGYTETDYNQVAFILKMDTAGNIIWFSEYPPIRELTSLAPATEGMMACGYTLDSTWGLPHEKAVILCTDYNGSVGWAKKVWDQRYNAFGDARYLQIVSVGGSVEPEAFVLTGYANEHNDSVQNADVLITSIDFAGQVGINFTYSTQVSEGQSGVFDKGISLVQTGNDAVFTANSTPLDLSGNALKNQINVTSVSLGNGNINWSRVYQLFDCDTNDADQFATKIIKTQSGFELSGWADVSCIASGHGDDGLRLMLGSLGVPQEVRFFGSSGQDRLYDILPVDASTRLLPGSGNSFTSNEQVWVVQSTDPFVGDCFNTSFEPAYLRCRMSKRAAIDSNLFVFRDSLPVQAYSEHPLDSSWCGNRNKDEESVGRTPLNEVLLWPNPAKDIIHLSNLPLPALCRIYDNVGQLCYTGRLDTNSKLNVSAITPGIYLVTIHAGDDPALILHRKLIIHR